MKNLQVRSATAADLIRIHQLDIESYGAQTTPITGLIWLVEHQGAMPTLFLSVGIDPGEAGRPSELAGFIAWKEVEPEPGAKNVEILHLVVAKNLRQEGYGEALVSAILDSARERGFRGASMTVPASAEKPVKLLTKLQFREYQRVPGYFNELGEAIVFAKVLNFPAG